MPRPTTPASPQLPVTLALARAIESRISTPGDHATAIPELTLHRRNGTTDELPCIYSLGLVVVVQGGKRLMLGEAVHDYRAGQSMLTAIDIPVVSHVSEASLMEPFLGLMLTFDMGLVLQLASELELPAPARDNKYQPLTVKALEPGLGEALLRLVQTLDEPRLLPRLAPLIQQEIIMRVLTGPHGVQLQHLATAGSPSQSIFRAVAWLKQNYVHELRMDDLADRAHMSPSTFRQHFRSITGVSPLQYQKQLRLQQARQLMLNQDMDAGRAAGLVGYESASQFSREYSRLFGEPPQRDIRRMRLG